MGDSFDKSIDRAGKGLCGGVGTAQAGESFDMSIG
jgi:hypothetical protein